MIGTRGRRVWVSSWVGGSNTSSFVHGRVGGRRPVEQVGATKPLQFGQGWPTQAPSDFLKPILASFFTAVGMS
jgi:hypothetical protein